LLSSAASHKATFVSGVAPLASSEPARKRSDVQTVTDHDGAAKPVNLFSRAEADLAGE